MRSCVSMLSLISTGMPCNGPRGPFARRSLSRSDAICNASGFNSMTALIAGPCLSTSSMRSRYFLASACALNLPEVMPLCSSAIVNSSSSNTGGGAIVADEMSDVSLAAMVMLVVARPAPPITLLRTNVLRFMVFPADGVMDRRHFYDEERVKSNGVVVRLSNLQRLECQMRISSRSSMPGKKGNPEGCCIDLRLELIGVPLRTLSASRFASGNTPTARKAWGSLSSSTR